MKSPEHGARPAVWPSAAPAAPALRFPLEALAQFVGAAAVMVEVELRKMRHDPTEMLTRLGQPVLWLLVIGPVFSRVRAIPTGDLPYMEFMAPGILAQSVLFVAIFYGITAVWEREIGSIFRYLASPAPRTGLVLGKALSAGVRALPLAGVVYLLALFIGVRLSYNPAALAGAAAVVLLSAAAFAAQSLIIACLMRSRERFMGIGQLLTMPMFFASNAIYPIAIMPPWLQMLAHVNPLTYAVDGLRSTMLAHPGETFGLGVDLAVLVFVTAVLVSIGGRLYARLGN